MVTKAVESSQGNRRSFRRSRPQALRGRRWPTTAATGAVTGSRTGAWPRNRLPLCEAIGREGPNARPSGIRTESDAGGGQVGRIMPIATADPRALVNAREVQAPGIEAPESTRKLDVGPSDTSLARCDDRSFARLEPCRSRTGAYVPFTFASDALYRTCRLRPAMVINGSVQ